MSATHRPLGAAVLAALMILPLAATPADAELDDLALLRTLTGRWQGELGYRDYRDDSRHGLPLTVVHESVGGGDYLLRRITFTDPGRQVHAVELMTVERDQGTLVISHFRDRTQTVETYTIQERAVTDAEHWRLVMVASSDDDGRLALVRLTQERDGELLTSVKDVQYLAGPKRGEWQYRNSTELRYVGP